MPDALAFAMGSLAVWRTTHFLVEEDGPWDVVVRVRRRLGASAAGRLMDCFYCVSVWAALPFAYWVARDQDLATGVVTWLALSAAGCLIERATAAGESR